MPLPDVDIRVLGYLRDAEDLAAAYGAADIFVGPSLEESFGQVFVEAAACGTPAVGYPVMGVRDAVADGITGRLAAAVGTEHLAASIRELIEDSARRAALGAWARIFVENEWSIEAGYRHLFLALHRLGILSKLGIPRRINFAPSPARRRYPAPRVWEPGAGIGEIEGPYLDDGIVTRFHRWSGTESHARLLPDAPGRYLIIIEYQNPWLPDQAVTISLGGRTLGTYSVVHTATDSTRLICLRAELSRGTHDLRLNLRQLPPPSGSDARRHAMMLNGIHLQRLPGISPAA